MPLGADQNNIIKSVVSFSCFKKFKCLGDVLVSVSVFLSLKKVGVRQNEDSDSKLDVGISTQARLPAIATPGGSGHAPPGFFFASEKALGVF